MNGSQWREREKLESYIIHLRAVSSTSKSRRRWARRGGGGWRRKRRRRSNRKCFPRVASSLTSLGLIFAGYLFIGSFSLMGDYDSSALIKTFTIKWRFHLDWLAYQSDLIDCSRTDQCFALSIHRNRVVKFRRISTESQPASESNGISKIKVISRRIQRVSKHLKSIY